MRRWMWLVVVTLLLVVGRPAQAVPTLITMTGNEPCFGPDFFMNWHTCATCGHLVCFFPHTSATAAAGQFLGACPIPPANPTFCHTCPCDPCNQSPPYKATWSYLVCLPSTTVVDFCMQGCCCQFGAQELLLCGSVVPCSNLCAKTVCCGFTHIGCPLPLGECVPFNLAQVTLVPCQIGSASFSFHDASLDPTFTITESAVGVPEVSTTGAVPAAALVLSLLALADSRRRAA